MILLPTFSKVSRACSLNFKYLPCLLSRFIIVIYTVLVHYIALCYEDYVTLCKRKLWFSNGLALKVHKSVVYRIYICLARGKPTSIFTCTIFFVRSKQCFLKQGNLRAQSTRHETDRFRTLSAACQLWLRDKLTENERIIQGILNFNSTIANSMKFE